MNLFFISKNSLRKPIIRFELNNIHVKQQYSHIAIVVLNLISIIFLDRHNKEGEKRKENMERIINNGIPFLISLFWAFYGKSIV